MALLIGFAIILLGEKAAKTIEGIALVAGVDRIFDMGRTTLNITGDASCAIIVSNMMKKKHATFKVTCMRQGSMHRPAHIKNAASKAALFKPS